MFFSLTRDPVPVRRRARTATAVAACLVGHLVSALPAPPAGAAPAAPTGWGPPVVENFDGTTLDPERWTAYDYPNNRPRRSADLARVEDGHLVLEGNVNSQGQEIGAGLADHFDQLYGRWEIRFRVDAGAGYGAAILLWPTSENWPDEGEIDILEVPKPPRNVGHHVAHLGPNNDQAGKAVNADFTTWHTVGVDWSPGQLVYYLDGAETWRAPANLVPDDLMRLALQLDECAPPVYGNWIPCRDASSPPTVEMEVDWVKVYPYDPNTPSTPPTTVPGQTPSPTTTPSASPSGPTVPAPPPARPVVQAPDLTG
jgi:hypothetical protein